MKKTITMIILALTVLTACTTTIPEKPNVTITTVINNTIELVPTNITVLEPILTIMFNDTNIYAEEKENKVTIYRKQNTTRINQRDLRLMKQKDNIALIQRIIRECEYLEIKLEKKIEYTERWARNSNLTEIDVLTKEMQECWANIPKYYEWE